MRINTYNQKKYTDCLESRQKLSSSGVKKEKSNASKQKEDTEDTCSLNLKQKNQSKIKPQKNQGEKFATVESPPTNKKKIYSHRRNTLANTTEITKLSLILDRVSTSREKGLKPYWTKQSGEISQKLWCPTETDCVDSVLTSSKESSLPTPLGKSWFSIKEKHPQTRSSLETSFRSSQYSLPVSMDSEVTLSKGNLNESVPVKTLKIRIFPTESQKTKLEVMFDQFRWYYNAILDLLKLEKKDKTKISYYDARDNILRKYIYKERIDENFRFIEYIKDKNQNKTMVPPWWEQKGLLHSEIPLGALKRIITAVKSSISNRGKNFTMKHKSKKSQYESVEFDTPNYPAFIRQINSSYWFRINGENGKCKRKRITFTDIWNDTKKRTVQVIHEKPTDRYFLHYCVNRDWFPREDRRRDNQSTSDENKIVSLDTGVRKFLVGYDPNGKLSIIGEGAFEKIKKLILKQDEQRNFKRELRIKNMVKEMHWKSIRYLTREYDTILYPNFKVSQMVRSKKLARVTKRLMLMFSFYAFKEKLKFKCDHLNRKLIIVDESYTSRTCSKCGKLNNIGSKETYHCIYCGMRGDRDILAARNILIKNISRITV